MHFHFLLVFITGHALSRFAAISIVLRMNILVRMLLVKANPLLKVSSKEVIGATFWIASTGC
jgi:hypothetical protein